MEFYTGIQQALDFVDVGVVNRVVKHWREKYQGWVGPGRRIFIIGNGGSCAISEHISTDLNKRCKVEAHTLSNNSLATCLANDYGYENALEQWLQINEINEFDYLVAISSSGKSPNILNAIQHALTNKIPVMAIFGMDGHVDDFYWEDGDNTFIHIDSHNYGIIELTTEIILHSMVEEMVIE
jgi:D-sedoheptulose 7-phosphate isomerase